MSTRPKRKFRAPFSRWGITEHFTRQANERKRLIKQRRKKDKNGGRK